MTSWAPATQDTRERTDRVDRAHATVPGTGTGCAPGPASLFALQRAAGNRAVAGLLAGGPVVQRCGGEVHEGCSCASEEPTVQTISEQPTVQRAERPELLSALHDAVAARRWQDVALRLNGLDKDDLASQALQLTPIAGANSYAAVRRFLAGWPREPELLSALATIGPQVVQLAETYRAYDDALAAADWTQAAVRLSTMSDEDVDARLRVLTVAQLVAVDGAAATTAPHLRAQCDAEVDRRGGPVPRSAVPADINVVGAFAVGGKLMLDVGKLEAGGQVAFRSADVVATGTRALVGPVQVAEDAVVVIKTGTAVGGGGAAGGGAAAGVGLVPALGVVSIGLAAGAAIALSPLAIAHAAEVAEALREFGGNLPPGGTGGGGGESDRCHDCADGTTARYGNLDSLGRATTARARIKGRPSPGSPPQADPAGWGRQGRSSGGSGHSGQGRAHLIAQSLGGLGVVENLVTFDQSVNTRMFNEVESVILNYAWTTPDHCVSVESQPLYEGDALVPYAIVVRAVDECTGNVVVVDTIHNRQLH